VRIKGSNRKWIFLFLFDEDGEQNAGELTGLPEIFLQR